MSLVVAIGFVARGAPKTWLGSGWRTRSSALARVATSTSVSVTRRAKCRVRRDRTTLSGLGVCLGPVADFSLFMICVSWELSAS